jgi:hypothetical protein
MFIALFLPPNAAATCMVIIPVISAGKVTYGRFLFLKMHKSRSQHLSKLLA